MMQKVGPANLKQHFMIMDTICDATQERQDAVYDLVGKQEQVPVPLSICVPSLLSSCIVRWSSTATCVSAAAATGALWSAASYESVCMAGLHLTTCSSQRL